MTRHCDQRPTDCRDCSTNLAEFARISSPHPVFSPPPPVAPECESSGCDCDDEFDTYIPEEG